MSKGRTLALPFRNSVHFSQEEAYALMRKMLSGEVDTDQIAQTLHYLRRKGETIGEIVGFASAIRDMSHPVLPPEDREPFLDTCGTGGDGTHTFNISTAAAFVAAGAGLQVAKHGNRKISSQCGSADVLEQLGIPTTLTAGQIGECIRQIGIGFLYAPSLHPGMAHVQDARRALMGRTVFNLLGPLTNPVRARVQLIGAYSVRAAEMLAQAAARLEIERAFVVHGADGLDEITTTGLTTVFQVEEGRVQKGQWTPADFGVSPSSMDDLSGGDVATNAQIVQAILNGEIGPKRDIVVVNAAAALLCARKTDDLRTAVALAAESIDSGAARGKLEQLAEYVKELPANEGL